jgi:sulfoxide reductase heme-binding subunit YedZ
MDSLAAFFSLLMIAAVTFWLWRSGAFTFSISDDPQLTWHMIRSTGITAHILLTMSLIWGLALNSQIVKNWSPGQVSMVMHSTVSWLAIAMTATHALLLLTDDYFSYLLTDLIVPFSGPYRPLAVGLGTLALWISLLVTLSFSIRKWIGQRVWKLLHKTSYLAFLLATTHGLFAGTDAEHLGFRIWLLVGVVLSLILLGYRLGRQHKNTNNRMSHHAKQANSRYMADAQASDQQ